MKLHVAKWAFVALMTMGTAAAQSLTAAQASADTPTSTATAKDLLETAERQAADGQRTVWVLFHASW